MNDTQIILTPKNWFKISFYILGVIFLPISLFMLYQYLTAGYGEDLTFLFNFLMILSAIVVLIGFSISLPILHRFNITINEKGIQQTGWINKSISYDEIDKIVVRKGMLEIRAGSILSNIWIGNLYQNFDQAIEHLSNYITAESNITFNGSDNYIDQYFGKN